MKERSDRLAKLSIQTREKGNVPWLINSHIRIHLFSKKKKKKKKKKNLKGFFEKRE